jgi:hypothetical protein
MSHLKGPDSEFSGRFKPFRPAHRPDSKLPPLVPPRSKRYGMVGTAFDYLFRFELQRLAPHAIGDRWIAEDAPDRIFHTKGGVSVAGPGLRLQKPDDSLFAQLPELAERAKTVIAAARDAVQDYGQQSAPSEDLRRSVAEHAVRLAWLDLVVRAGYLDRDFATAPDEDVEDVLGMLAATPFDRFVGTKPIILNPRFGQSSRALGGADADFIAGDLLVDIKVKSECGGLPAILYDQLLGYVLLSRIEHSKNPQLPEIRRAGFLFPRQGYVWNLDVAEWETMPGFSAFEAWFANFLEAEVHRREGQVQQVREQLRGPLSAAAPGASSGRKTSPSRTTGKVGRRQKGGRKRSRRGN